MDRQRFLASPTRWIGACAVGLFALVAAAPAQAADFLCADLKPSETLRPAYQRITGQARCEGFFAQHVSQPFVELISLTASAPPRDATALEVSASHRASMQLVVQPLRPAPFYRVDAWIEAAQATRWNAAPMLGATGLQLRDLGFLARAAGPSGTLTFVPVTFTGAAAAPLAASAVVRASVPVSKLAWRRLRKDGSDDGSGGWREVPGSDWFAWQRVPITLELPTDGSSVQIDVQAVDPAGKTLPLLHFNMAGPADALP